MNLKELLAERERINAAITAIMSGSSAQPIAKPDRKNKGKPTVWGDFSKKIQTDHKEQIAAYKAAHPGEKSAHLSYVTNYRKEHPEVYDAHKLAWKEAHPDEAISESEKSGDEKPKRVISEEQKAKMKAGREKKKASLAEAPAPEAPAPEAPAPEAPAPEAPAAEVVPVAAEKPKRIISEEQKAKMKAGREKKKAEKDALVGGGGS